MAFGINIGGSKTSSDSRSFVDPLQQPFLDFLRNSGMSLAGNFRGAQGFGQQAGQELYGMGLQQLQGLQGNPFMQSLQAQAGGNPELVQQQVNQLGQDIGFQFQNQIMPSIGREAVGIGAFGGSRQGVAEGIAGRGAADALSRGITDIYSQDARRQLEAASIGGGLYSQNALGGLASMGDLMNVGLSQFTGGFAPLLAYNQIVGAPTVLDTSRTRSKSFNAGGSFGF